MKSCVDLQRRVNQATLPRYFGLLFVSKHFTENTIPFECNAAKTSHNYISFFKSVEIMIVFVSLCDTFINNMQTMLATSNKFLHIKHFSFGVAGFPPPSLAQLTIQCNCTHTHIHTTATHFVDRCFFFLSNRYYCLCYALLFQSLVIRLYSLCVHCHVFRCSVVISTKLLLLLLLHRIIVLTVSRKLPRLLKTLSPSECRCFAEQFYCFCVLRTHIIVVYVIFGCAFRYAKIVRNRYYMNRRE